MKSPKKTFRTNKHKKQRSERVVPPPIEFTPSSWYKNEGDEYVMTFKLRASPTEKNSPVYEMTAKSFATGSVEQFIHWKRDLYKIIKGQHITKVQDKFTMAKRLLHGDALAVFEATASALDCIEDDEFELAMMELALHVFPKNALTNQKSWLRRSTSARKASDMLTRHWVARIREINLMFPDFPPDFDDSQMLRTDDLIDILEFGIPNAWKAKMVEAGFVPADHSPAEFVEFCERLESAEQMLGLTNFNKTAKKQEQKGSMPKDEPDGTETHSGSSKTNAKTPQQRKNTQKRCQSFVDSNGKSGCGYHIHSETHSSNECKVLMAQASSMRGQAEAQSQQRQKNSGKSGKSGGDLHSLMAKVQKMSKTVEKLKKSRNSKNTKKRAREDSDSGEESDKNFDTDNFHLDLEETSINGDSWDGNVGEIDWSGDETKNNADE
jgi:hypothetical protein